MRESVNQWKATAASIALLAGISSAKAAPILNLDANTGVLNTSAAPAGNGDSVGTWQDQSPAGNNATVPGGSTSPQYSTNYSATGNNAVAFTGSTNRLTTPAPVISGTTDFLITAKFYVVNDQINEHVIATTFGVGNSSGFEFMEHKNLLKFYAGLTGQSANNYVGGSSSAGIDLSTRNNTFLNVAATRAGNVYTIYADLNSDGDFLDSGESLSGTIGTATSSLSATKPLMIGNIDYGASPIAMNSLEIWVPEPTAASAALLAVSLVSPVARRVRRR